MTENNWSQVREIFDEAVQRQVEERAAYLSQVCGEDQNLRDEVQSLLDSLEGADSFLEFPVLAEEIKSLETKTQKLKNGQTLGHYQIIRTIGSGGMGEVYLAQDQKLDRQVAVKILNEKFARHESNLNRFIKEAKAASALNHPNILTIYEFGEVENTHYLVSEFIQGQTLREMLKRSDLKLSEILDVSIQIANALCTAHETCLIHRDIKPENVMVRPDGLVKVLDFGLAKLVGQKNKSVLGPEDSIVSQKQTAKGIILGTVDYMSPEQAKGEKVDERTDIFSLGAVIYEMIAGRTPFAGNSTWESFANLINTELQPLSHFVSKVPKQLEDIISRMLRKNKAERYQTIQDVFADLKEFRENLSPEVKLERSALFNENATQGPGASTADGNKRTNQTSDGWRQKIKLNRMAGYVLIALLAGTLTLGVWFAKDSRTTSVAPILSASFVSEKLSSNGKVHHAIISPDGKNVVYTNHGSNNNDSLWMRELETGNNFEMVSPAKNNYLGLAFSPDGSFIYFVRRPIENNPSSSAIYRLSVSGGIPNKILDGDVQGWISLSPDAKQVSFVRCHYRADDYCSLWIADAADGSNQKKIFSRANPFRISTNAFSPDGKLIAFASGQSNNAANDFSLSVIDVESGVQSELTSEKFFDIRSLSWLPDQKNLLLTAARIPNKNVRIWQLSVETGKVEPVTKDSEVYSDLSLDQSAGLLVATKIKEDFRLRVLDLETGSEGLVIEESKEISYATDGKILYTATMSGNDEIWSINPDGSGQKQLTNVPADDKAPVASFDNRFVYFVSNRTGAAQVWRTDPDGSNQIQLTHENGGFPLFASPDGEWVYYHHGMDRTLWRVSTRSREEQQVLKQAKSRFAFSPDGSLLAFTETKGPDQLIVIYSLNAGKTIKTFKLPPGKLIEIEWLPDGKQMTYILADDEFQNYVLWIQPLEGDPSPRKIFNLGNQQIYGFAAAPDGKNIAIVQGDWLHDAVLLRGLK